MNNIVIALIIAAVSSGLVFITESKKENRQSASIRSFVITFLVSFVALTYLVHDGFSSQDIETCEPTF